MSNPFRENFHRSLQDLLARISLTLHNGSPAITPTSARGALGPTTGSSDAWWSAAIAASRPIARDTGLLQKASCAITCATGGERSRQVDLSGRARNRQLGLRR